MFHARKFDLKRVAGCLALMLRPVMGAVMVTVLTVGGLPSEGWAQRSIQVVKRSSPRAGGSSPRVALVIGNSNYKIAPLRNPVNDAQDMAKVLEKSGFAVTLLVDADRRKMEKGIRDFGNSLKGSEAGLFFYAGHGMQVKGVNYLIPVGASIESEDEVEHEAVSANRILSKMESARNKLNMVFLDACRNNPFTRSFRSGNQGLAAVRNAPRGSVISYATDAGSVAADGKGRNGTYTANLLKQISVPGVELSQLMKRVRAGVQKETQGKQTPYELSSLTGDFYFFPSKPGESRSASMAAAPPSIDPEDALWRTVQNSNDRQDFRDYLREFPKGKFARLAAVKIRQLSRPTSIPRKGGRTQGQQQAAMGGQAGQPFQEPSTGIQFLWVEPGSFEMGCGNWNNGECDGDEKPLRTVRLGGFWIGATEVTQAQWEKIMGGNPSAKKGASRPVESVSWQQAQAFVAKLNKSGAGSYRLPTEAEWEFACRAGGKESKFPWGKNEPVCRSGEKNGARHDGGGGCGTGTENVGTYGANGLGLSDMAGNVWEWVEDVYNRSGYSKTGMDNPVYNASGRYRVIRGGGWDSKSRSLRCAERYGSIPSYGAPNIGFRLVRSR